MVREAEIHATIAGSNSNTYGVGLYFFDDSSSIEATCTCPYFSPEADTCKHIAAVICKCVIEDTETTHAINKKKIIESILEKGDVQFASSLEPQKKGHYQLILWN